MTIMATINSPSFERWNKRAKSKASPTTTQRKRKSYPMACSRCYAPKRIRQEDGQFPLLKGISPKFIEVDTTAGKLRFPESLGALWSPARPEALPSFIRPLPSRISGENLDYIIKKDALAIPESRLRKELLRCFIQFVYGYLPLVQLSDLLRIADVDDISLEPISLLVFQSIMFAASAFIDLGYLEQAGFQCRKAARETYFQRAKLLYDFDCEPNQISCIQALLMMTYWNDTPDKEKDTWHWMSMSLLLSDTLGLHRNPERLSHITAEEQRLRKRIWWSCFMRDHLIALGMRRPTRIKSADFDVPVLTLEDFELPLQASAIARALEPCPFLQSSRHMTQISSLCIEKIKLCLIVGRVLDSEYSPRYLTNGHPVRLIPKMAATKSQETFQCNQELQKWLNQVPDDAQCPNYATVGAGSADVVTFVHRALLKMVYHAIAITLHRPQLLSTSNQTIPPGKQYLAKSRVLGAATEVINIANDLHEQNLSRFLPTSGVTALVPAIAVHMLRIKSTDSLACEASLRRFRQGIKVLNQLREMYISAEVANSFLHAAIQKRHIPILDPSSSLVGVDLPLQESAVHKDDGQTFLANTTLSTDEASALFNLSAEPQRALGQESQGSAIYLKLWGNFLSEDGDRSDYEAVPKFDGAVLADIDSQSNLDIQGEIHGESLYQGDLMDTGFDATDVDLLSGAVSPKLDEDWSLLALDSDEES